MFIVNICDKDNKIISSATFSNFDLASEFARGKSSQDNYSTLEIVSKELLLIFRKSELSGVISVD